MKLSGMLLCESTKYKSSSYLSLSSNLKIPDTLHFSQTLKTFYYNHFEITGDPCNLIGSQQCDLFMNQAIFFSKSHLFKIRSFKF